MYLRPDWMLCRGFRIVKSKDREGGRKEGGDLLETLNEEKGG
jgi:hypothetical protein